MALANVNGHEDAHAVTFMVNLMPSAPPAHFKCPCLAETRRSTRCRAFCAGCCQINATSLDVPEGMPVYDLQTDFPWAFANAAQGTEMLSRVLEVRAGASCKC